MLEPSGPSKAVVESPADRQHQQQACGITERPLQLRHVLEIHAVDPGDRGRDRKDRCPAAELLDDIVLSGCRQKQARLEGGRQTLAQIADRLVHQQHVIVDIAKVRSYGGVSSREVMAPQLVTDLDHWRYGMAHVEEPGAQPVNPLDLSLAGRTENISPSMPSSFSLIL